MDIFGNDELSIECAYACLYICGRTGNCQGVTRIVDGAKEKVKEYSISSDIKTFDKYRQLWEDAKEMARYIGVAYDDVDPNVITGNSISSNRNCYDYEAKDKKLQEFYGKIKPPQPRMTATERIAAYMKRKEEEEKKEETSEEEI